MDGSTDDTGERQKLATRLTMAGVIGVTVLGLTVIAMSENHGSASEHVMAAVLPLFGSWVATVLAYYFARENLRAATSSVSALMSSQTTDDGLSAISVKAKMIERARIVALSDKFKSIDSTLLKDVTAHLSDRSVRRSPVFDDKGVVVYMIHASTLDQFIRDKAMAGVASDTLKFSDLLGVPAQKAMIEKTFVFVPETATLADAKAKMHATPDCEDVFVTKTGAATEPVIGWITDNLIFEVSK